MPYRGTEFSHSGKMVYNSASAKQSTCTSYERSRSRESVQNAAGVLSSAVKRKECTAKNQPILNPLEEIQRTVARMQEGE